MEYIVKDSLYSSNIIKNEFDSKYWFVLRHYHENKKTCKTALLSFLRFYFAHLLLHLSNVYSYYSNKR